MPVTAAVFRPDTAQYDTLLTDAGLFDRSDRGKLALSGPDAAAFLDSLLSNEIGALASGAGADATLLTPQGRMLAEVRIIRLGESYLLDTERVALQALFDALHQFKVGYRVELHKRTLESGLLSVIGPVADQVVGSSPPVSELSATEANIAGGEAVVVRTDQGLDVICESERTAAVAEELERRGARWVDEDAVECLRVERGRPRFGIDIDERTMPQEAGIHERTVSYSKGCYIGQETVARLYWKGKPNRHLRGLRLSGTATPGAAVRSADRDVGALGSVAISPRFGPIALGLLRREVGVGDRVEVGDGEVTAELVALPFSA